MIETITYRNPHALLRSRISTWYYLTRYNSRGLLIFDSGTAACIRLNENGYWDKCYNWIDFPDKYLKLWLRIGALQKDEEFEIEQALGVKHIRNCMVHIPTQKGISMYMERCKVGKEYL